MKFNARNFIKLLYLTIVVLWLIFYITKKININEQDVINISGSIIQGMSGVLGISIAIILFRIQSLENSGDTIKRATLTYIYQIIGWTYPNWSDAVINDINDDNIIDRYKLKMIYNLPYGGNIEIIPKDTLQEINNERGRQQSRLKDSLISLNNIDNKIDSIQKIFLISVVHMIVPIVISLSLLIIAKIMSEEFNYFLVSFNVLTSVLGIVLLIDTVFESTRRK